MATQKTSTKLNDKARAIVLDTYKKSKDFYRANKNEFTELWNLAHSIPLKKKKKFNRFIPYIATAIDLILPRLAGRLPAFDIEALQQENKDKSIKLNKLTQYFMDKTNFHDFELKFIKASLIYGTAIAQIGWCYYEGSTHPKNKAKKANSKDEPEYSIIPLEWVYPHPKKIAMQDQWPIVIREEVSRRELLADEELNQDEMKNLGAPVATDDEFFSQINRSDTTNQNQLTNRNEVDKGNDVFVKLTYWGPFDLEQDGGSTCSKIVVVNGDAVGCVKQNPFYHQQLPFSKLDYNPDSQRFFNEGLTKQLADLQLELNEIRNVRSAARAIALKKPLIVDRNANVNTENLVFEDGAIWLADFSQNPNPIREVQMESKLLELQNEEEAVKRDMQTRSGINDVVLGTSENTSGQADTATAANLAAESTTMRFRTQAVLIDQVMKEIGDQTIANIQQFVTSKLRIRVLGDEGTEWQEVTPEDIAGEYDFRVQPMATMVEPKSNKRTNLIQLKQLFADDPTIDQTKLDKMILDAYDLDPDSVKKNQDQQGMDMASNELEQLAQQINSPEFSQLPPDQQMVMKQRLQQLMQHVQGGQGDGQGNAGAGGAVLPPQPGGAAPTQAVGQAY